VTRSRLSPTVRGVVAALALTPILFVIWFVATFYLVLESGGTLGGYGEAARPGAAWVGSVSVFIAMAMVAIDVWVGFVVSRRATRRAQHPAPTTGDYDAA